VNLVLGGGTAITRKPTGDESIEITTFGYDRTGVRLMHSSQQANFLQNQRHEKTPTVSRRKVTPNPGVAPV
jgi:hypothetical protein